MAGPEATEQDRSTVMNSLLKSLPATDRKAYLPDYPGFETVFGVQLEPAAADARVRLPANLYDIDSNHSEPHLRVRAAIAGLVRRLTSVRELYDVAVVHLPDSWEPGLRDDGFDAHDELKALCAVTGIPTQVINDRTFKFGYHASRAWRLAIALYVKAGGTPWKLAPIPGLPSDSAFIGLAYSLRINGDEVRYVTCCSQVFDADGGGMQFLAYDARDPIEDTESARRNPYLSRNDMRAVLARSLRLYQSRNGGRVPTRIAIHKNTTFRDDETSGALDALAAVPEVDCVQIVSNVAWRGVWLQTPQDSNSLSTPARFPVTRGTMAPLSGTETLLWVAGNAPAASGSRYGNYYQGEKSIPTPLLLRRHAGRGPLELIATEALALSKMDWNNDALYNPLPVTLNYARRLARTIAHVPGLPRDVYPYRLFM